MSTDKDKSKIFYYRQSSKGHNYSPQNFWCPGDILKEEDEALLQEVKAFYQKNGYSPRKEDMKPQLVCKLKSRFRIWKNVILAAGLPDMNSAEMQQKRKIAQAEGPNEECSKEEGFKERRSKEVGAKEEGFKDGRSKEADTKGDGAKEDGTEE